MAGHDHHGTSPSRRYRIPTQHNDAQSEQSRASKRFCPTEMATCLKCGKRKAESQRGTMLSNQSQLDATVAKKQALVDKGLGRGSREGSPDGLKENNIRNQKAGFAPTRQAPVTPDYAPLLANSQQTVQSDSQDTHHSSAGTADHQFEPRQMEQDSSNDFSSRAAITRKIDKNFLPRSNPPPGHKRPREQGRDKRTLHRTHASKSTSRSPADLREEKRRTSFSRAPSSDATSRNFDLSALNHRQRMNLSGPACNTSSNALGSSVITQKTTDSETLRPKDFSEMGRRIWQTLFEATDGHYLAPSTTTLLSESAPPATVSGTARNLERDDDPTVTGSNYGRPVGSVLPRHVRWQTHSPSRGGSRPSFQPSIAYPCNAITDSEHLMDGKYIRMKFGKKVKMVQIPSRTTGTADDEVQVLVRHGKSVIWRNYKTFDHE